MGWIWLLARTEKAPLHYLTFKAATSRAAGPQSQHVVGQTEIDLKTKAICRARWYTGDLEKDPTDKKLDT